MRSDRPQDVLRHIFGYHTFRGHQQAVIEHVCGGGDALVVMPTGGGKSLCYQIPSLIRDGMGVVVSPLIALMHDQVQGLRQLGLRAACLNSSQGVDENRSVWRDIEEGNLDLLYVAPERLLTPEFLERLTVTRLALFAIDEAHCVSQWGHDFRPEYRQLEILHQRFPKIPRIAVTATADSGTRDEIVQHLGLQQAAIFIGGFDRVNIRYHMEIKREPRRQLLEFLEEQDEEAAGIVYCLSRDKVEKTAQWLNSKGYRAVPYHAGLEPETRRHNQDLFIHEEGVIVVATVAFGMGIDKPNVRFVAHLDLPKSVEAFYQETGRAGRDGLPAQTLLLYGLHDIVVVRRFIENSDANEQRKRIERAKLQLLTALCESVECRRSVLLRYFGENFPGPCNNCDNCLHPPEVWDGTEAARKALSCVYRTQQRYGAAHCAAILIGERSERIERLGHDRLSTFGVGKELPLSEWLAIYRQLTASGYLQTDPDGYGVLSLTRDAQAILRGDRSVYFRREVLRPRVASPKRSFSQTSGSESSDIDEVLFGRLKQKRMALAKAGRVPPYVIFHDKTLKEIAAIKPRTLDELAMISGVGEHKLERYGATILDVVNER